MAQGERPPLADDGSSRSSASEDTITIPGPGGTTLVIPVGTTGVGAPGGSGTGAP